MLSRGPFAVVNSPDSPDAKPRWRRASVLMLSLLGILFLLLAVLVSRSMQHEWAAKELRTMGFEAGSPSIVTMLRTNWRGIFGSKWRQWDDRVRLMSSSAVNLDAFGPALRRFEPRGVLLGFCGKLEDVSALRGLPKLERLDFYQCPNVKDIGIVSEFGKLKELTFCNSPALHSLAIIKSGANLTSLHITHCHALDDMEALRELTSLRSLYLAGCPAVKDAELLRGLALLEELDLSGCSELTDVGGLQGLKVLKTVNLQRCPKLKSEAVAALRAALPGAKISFP